MRRDIIETDPLERIDATKRDYYNEVKRLRKRLPFKGGPIFHAVQY